MLKRDELTSPNSCLNKTRDDEWLFVLLGRDLAAPAAVRAWVAERIRLGKNARQDAQILEAERWIKTVLAEQTSSKCSHCGAPATCHGIYEGQTGYACDTCCGHGNEDGECEPTQQE